MEKLNEEQVLQKAQKIKTLKQNQKLIELAYKKKFKRHIKVKDEPVLSAIVKKFENDYAKNVAGNSALEILKLVKDEF